MIGMDELGRIVFGCGNFGGMGSSPALLGKGDDDTTALALLDHARGVGLTSFDTANTYGGGASEMVLGRWLRSLAPSDRSGLRIATKVGNPHGPPAGERPLSAGQVAHHLDVSLRRLGLERIDLYYLHELDPSTPLEETLGALDLALAAGKIAAFGVSNASAGDLRNVLALVGDGALRRAFTHVQNEFNRLHTDDLAEVIPLTRAEAIAYVAFSPLAGGLLTGKYRQGRPPDPGTRVAVAPGFYEDNLGPSTFAAIDELAGQAAARGWSVPGAALRFILDTPGVDALIVAPRTLAQFEGYGIGAGRAAG